MKQGLGRTLKSDDGAFEIYRLVASGGFASVYFGRDLDKSTPVAVKLLHPHHTGDPRVLGLFEREARLVRGLRHPHIVQVLGQGRDEDDIPFIVMEWVTGWTIADLIEKRRAYPSGEAATVGCQVLDALGAAVARGVIHRDIKPLNVMVTPEGVVKVMDFGIAKEGALAAVSGSSAPIGTWQYMAPEQFRGEKLDCRSDLYSFGVTLYQMLAGRAPFEATSMAAYMYHHLQTLPPPLVSVRPDVSPALAAVVHRALAKAPADRFQTPGEMHAALRRFADRQVTPPPPVVNAHGPILPTVPNGREPGTATVLDDRQLPQPPRAKRGTPWAVIVAGLLLVVAGGVGYYLFTGGPSGSPPSTVPPPTVVVTGTVGPPPTADGGPGAAACQEGLQRASDLILRKAWTEAAAQLEPLRAIQGCGVTGPLYDVYLNWGTELAETEQTAEAIGHFEKALQVKDGSEARRERELAVAYRGGRDALERKAWPTAIELLTRVHQGNSTYARGNVVPHLINAYLGHGDELMRQSKPAEALGIFRLALALKPNDPAITDRIRAAEAAIAAQATATAAAQAPAAAQPTVPNRPVAPPTAAAPPVPIAPPPAPTAPPTPSRPPLDESLARDYYRAVNERRYHDAYNLLSRASQSQQTYAEFERQFSQTLVSIAVRSTDGLSRGDTTASLVAHTTTVSRGNRGEVTECWRVDWRLVLEDGRWRRDSLSQTSEGC